MTGRLLEIAVRPVRAAFLIGKNPSNRLLNSVISLNSGMWGGIYNLLCPTNGSLVTDEYLLLLNRINPDRIVLCGTFDNHHDILRQLQQEDIYPCFLDKRIPLADIDLLAIGIDGIFDAKFLQDWQRDVVTAVVDPRQGQATIFDKIRFGIPPDRLRKYIENRFDLITVNHYKRESQHQESSHDQFIGMVDVTAENLDRYALRTGRRIIEGSYLFGWPYFVIGKEHSLEDACYYWNLRAMLGSRIVRWVERSDLTSFMSTLHERIRPPVTRRVTITSITEDIRKAIEQELKDLKVTDRSIRFTGPKEIFRRGPNFAWKSEIRREHTSTPQDDFVIPLRKPSSFELLYPRRYQHWVMDFRIVTDEVIGTEGFILPSRFYLAEMVTRGRAAHLKPRITGEVFSLQVTSAPTDEYIRLRIPSDWEVIQTIFSQAGYRIDLSDQGKYMHRTLSLFGGLRRLSALLRDDRVIAILDEFLKHHRTGQQLAGEYRRVLTLDDMRNVIINLLDQKSRKKKDETSQFVDHLLRQLMEIGAVHSGYILDCTHCNLEEWYPIDSVGETFRCRRCLATQIRPPSPAIFFRLNEALYQAYLNNFTVPSLVLDTLNNSSRGSYIFAPQIKLNAADILSPEIDIVAICDGILTLGEARSTNNIEKKKIDILESTAFRIKAQHIVIATSSRHTCQGTDCNTCSRKANYADNAFAHGSDSDKKFWGPRERIKDLRGRLFKQGIHVITICGDDISKRLFQRNLRMPLLAPARTQS
jgi:hypothetical protein